MKMTAVSRSFLPEDLAIVSARRKSLMPIPRKLRAPTSRKLRRDIGPRQRAARAGREVLAGIWSRTRRRCFLSCGTRSEGSNEEPNDEGPEGKLREFSIRNHRILVFSLVSRNRRDK